MLNAQCSMLNRRRGYTLIEIMVVLTIGVILGTVGMVKYRDASKRQAVDAAAEKLVSALRKAQSNAAAGKKGNCGGVLAGWEVTIYQNSYTTWILCGTTPILDSSETFSSTLITTNAESGINPNPILFNVLNTGTNITSGSTSILIWDTKSNYQRTINVTSTGSIQLQ